MFNFVKSQKVYLSVIHFHKATEQNNRVSQKRGRHTQSKGNLLGEDKKKDPRITSIHYTQRITSPDWISMNQEMGMSSPYLCICTINVM